MIFHELYDNRTCESSEDICILYPHLFSDLGAIMYDNAIEHS